MAGLAYHSACYLLYDGRFPASLLLQRRRMSELRGSPAQSDAANTSKESGEYTVLRWNSCTWFWQKTRVFCSILFAVPSTSGFYRKFYTTLVLKLHTKKSAKQKTRVWEDSSLCPETSTKLAAQEFHHCFLLSKRFEEQRGQAFYSMCFLFNGSQRKLAPLSHNNTITLQSLHPPNIHPMIHI